MVVQHVLDVYTCSMHEKHMSCCAERSILVWLIQLVQPVTAQRQQHLMQRCICLCLELRGTLDLISITQMCQLLLSFAEGYNCPYCMSYDNIKLPVSGLEEQLSRMQAVLDQWKTNDSVQLETARKDLDRLKQQLEAQSESAKVASSQCKSAQTELKAVKQQLATQTAATQAGQAEIDSLKQDLATQAEISSSAQTELDSDRDSLRAQLSTSQAELANLQQQLSLRDESGASERKDFDIQTAELESSNRQQAQQLQRAEDEVQAMAFECRHLNVCWCICKSCARAFLVAHFIPECHGCSQQSCL